MTRECHVRFCESAGVRSSRAIHLVILSLSLSLSLGRAAEALEWTDRVMTRLGLTLNRTKTRLCGAWKEQFGFLGYSFGVHVFRQTGRRYLGAGPCDGMTQIAKSNFRLQGLKWWTIKYFRIY